MSYCYGSSYGQPCGAGAWTLGGSTSGFQNEANTAFPGTATPSGSYYAFIQSYSGTTPGSIAQAVTLGAGTYVVNWLAAGRSGAGNEGYTVSLGGNQVFSGATTSGSGFLQTTSDVIKLAAGSYDLTFVGAAQGGDNTAFIDRVSISSVPEPATWAMMMMGFGIVGFAMRRRKQAASVGFA